MKHKVLKICCGNWKNASHDKRELSVCRELGAEVLVLAKGEESDCGRKEDVDGYEVHRYTTRPWGKRTPNFINRIVSIFLWARYARSIQPTVISGHDLDGLTIGWISTWFLKKEKKPKLVYDSHEFELYRNANRNSMQLFFVKHLERFLIRKCVLTVMVNDNIAEEVQELHGLKERPLSIRNIPELWDIDLEVCKDIRKQINEALRKKCKEAYREQALLLMYHGLVIPGRGIETLIHLLAKNDNIYVFCLGNSVGNYDETLKALAKEKKVENRILFHPAVPMPELWKYVGSVDVGMILAPALCKNHLYSLPNKFFENIQGETPVICPNYPAMGKLVDEYRIGLKCDPTDYDALNECIEKMRTESGFYEQCKENAKVAKRDLCWEKEKVKLKDAYKKVFED